MNKKIEWETMLGIGWIVCWFLAIWVKPFAGQLFMTGLFLLGLGLLEAASDDKKKKKKV